LSPVILSSALQEDFVRTELETGHRMLELAIKQRDLQEFDAAAHSLTLAKVALSGAHRHLSAVKLPGSETKEIYSQVRELRRQIESFDGGRKKEKRTRPGSSAA